jgi:SAM-dependent methyltransferase
MRANLFISPFRPGTFDAITCVSTIEHIGCFVYGQFVDRFGDEVAMRHMRKLLRPGGRLLLTTPYGKGAVYSWLRVYNKTTFGRLIGGYKALSVEFYKRNGEEYLPCSRDDLVNGGFDHEKLRSDGVVMAVLEPAGGLNYLIARISLRVRRFLHERAGRPQFWTEPA